MSLYLIDGLNALTKQCPDLCVAAVLDAVKERVEVPWRASRTPNAPDSAASSSTSSEIETPATVALLQTTSSSSSDGEAVQGQIVSEKRLLPSEGLGLTTKLAPPSEDIASEVVDSDSLVIDEVKGGDQGASSSDKENEPSPETAVLYQRTIHLRNFEKALTEITPSASESLGSLAELRKWNEEFGEGRKQRKQVVWGKGRFGFTLNQVDDSGAGRVSTDKSTSSNAPDSI